MKFETWNRVITGTLLATLVIPSGVAAQNTAKRHHPHQYHHYQLIDVGTFGGPNSSYLLPPPGSRLLNNSGTAVGGADTSTPEPYCPCFNFDCYLSYGFKWQNGVTHTWVHFLVSTAASLSG